MLMLSQIISAHFDTLIRNILIIVFSFNYLFQQQDSKYYVEVDELIIFKHPGKDFIWL